MHHEHTPESGSSPLLPSVPIPSELAPREQFYLAVNAQLELPPGFKRTLYGGGCFDFEGSLYMTNADETILLDRMFQPASYDDGGTPFYSLRVERFLEALEGWDAYDEKPFTSFYDSPFMHLKKLGVSRDDIRVGGPENPLSGSVQLTFPWRHSFESEPKERRMVLKSGRVEEPDRYLDAIRDGVHCYLQMGSEYMSTNYAKYLPAIAACMPKGVYFLTDDRVMGYDDKVGSALKTLADAGIDASEKAYAPLTQQLLSQVEGEGIRNCIGVTICRKD